MRFDEGRLRCQSRELLRVVALHRLKELPLLPADVVVQLYAELAHEFLVARCRLRFAIAPLRQTPQVRVLVKQPVPQRRRPDKREEQPLFIIKVCPDLRTPRVEEAGDRKQALRPFPISRLSQTPGLDQPAHVLPRQRLERRVTLQRRSRREWFFGAVVRHRVIVFSMCASLNILGRTPDHDFDEPIGLLMDCHRRIEMFLELLQRAVREHADTPLSTLTAGAIRNAQRYFAKAAPKHTADEEESLFPRLRAAAQTQGKDCAAISRLEGDHEHADRLHSQVDGLLEAWLREGSLPAERSTELGSILATLRELYREHIHMEETEVFPLAGSLLSPSNLSAVGLEMRARGGLAAPE